ncbi:MAG: heavy metal translocating P-type ATPase [Deltaproteobacteria bacterium]|jgi:Cu2+-exporting ATPase|nr:heavy metal translocating P-type ATPase [Deltaproteobacteria bacterium]
MDGNILSDLNGRIRIKLSSPGLTPRAFDRLSAVITKLGALKYLSYNPLSNRILLLYKGGLKARSNLLSALAEFDPGQSRALAGFELTVQAVGEDTPLPFNPIWNYLLKKIILPAPIRYAITAVKAIPYLFEGLKYLLWRGQLTVEVLDASALTVLFYRRNFSSAGTLLFFFSLSNYLEAWTKRRSLSGLYRSLSGHEEIVWIVNENGEEVKTKESEISVGQKVVVRAGGLIPVDGRVLEGEAMVNQATMTGEPLPVRKSVGGAVFAGTTIEEGRLVLRADKVGGQTRIRSIIDYITESEASKSGVQGRAERIADSIVPYNFILAGLVYLFTQNPLKAGNVLLVDYSCAIRLSTPLVVLTAMREGNECGVLVKGGRYFEELDNADTVVFDKTGTLTEAKPELGEVRPFEPYERNQALRLAACLEEHFPHPVGRAVVRQAQKENLKHHEEHTTVNYVVAHGISSTWHERKVLLGSRHFIVGDEKIVLTPEEEKEVIRLSEDGSSLVYLAVDDKLAALIVIKDKLREGVKETIEALRSSDIDRVVMLTGDLETAAKHMASRAGFTEYRAELLPDQKASIIKELRQSSQGVIMVGDGLNDSAALSQASVGVAMHDGSELAKDVAKVQLLNGNIKGLALARVLSGYTMRRIHYNYRLIILLNSLFLTLGLFGIIGPTITALLHNSTTIMVALRATRPLLVENSQNPKKI